MKIPRLVIAGTNSGCGKTTITAGILAGLVKRGHRVQPFKVGPDYIDPMFHTYITKRHSRNLDSWMLEEETLKYLFAKNAADADITVIEGVMGMYDGFGAKSKVGSTAHVAVMLQAPVILVLNAEGMSLSAAAIVEGFRTFDRDVNIRGVILNNIKTDAHYELLKDAIEFNTKTEVLGYLPRRAEYALEGRHLGLVTAGEIDNLQLKMDMLVQQIEKTLNLDRILEIAQQTEEVGSFSPPLMDRILAKNRTEGPKIAVAMDYAFNFYYRDNLDLLENLGANLEFFSPLKDEELPKGIQGLYLGGGYPEIHAAALQDNTSMRRSIRKHIQGGLPTYAECGGFMYLTESIKTREGNCFDMVGVIPGYSEMTTSLKRFGYVEVEATAESVICQPGFTTRAHEFHYSATHIPPETGSCFRVVKRREGKPDTVWLCGCKAYNVLAGYPHLHFWANPDFAIEFVKNCSQYKADS